MTLLVLITGGIYILVIASFFYGWERLKPFESDCNTAHPFVSVIIPMRDEEENIGMLLNDLAAQDYPAGSFEIIVVDDHSVDNSVSAATAHLKNNMRILSLNGKSAGKKAALKYGTDASKGEIIITTDADCRISKSWISTMASFFGKNDPVLVLGPVMALPSKNVFGKILSLEMFSLLGSTAGSAAIGNPVMSNGANLAYLKKVYPEIAGIYNEKISSGDDIFVLLELKNRYRKRIHFIKSRRAAVFTRIPSSVSSFFRQRQRWVSKSRYYKDPGIIITALTVFAVNGLLVISLIYGVLQNNFSSFLILLIMKSFIDFPFLFRVTSFFGQKKLMAWFPVVQSIYFLYVCITVAAGTVLRPRWKEQSIR